MSFESGGKVITAAGTYNTENNPKDLSGNTLHGNKLKNYRWYFCTATGKAVKIGKLRQTDATASKIFFLKEVTKLS